MVVPLWARKKDRRKRSFLVPRWALPPPAASQLPPRGRLGEDPQTPSHHRFPVVLAISRLSTVVPAFSRPWAPSTLNPSPRGRGLGGRSRRSPDGSVASLRPCPKGPFHPRIKRKTSFTANLTVILPQILPPKCHKSYRHILQ